MAEIDLGMLADIGFDLIPVALIVPYPFARCADRQETADFHYFGQGVLKFIDQTFSVFFDEHAFGDVFK